ncbi:MAG: hypothetical protein Q8O00_12135 [Holophaga sp.]|nr:hypothetical protein [Holophaga sp.]
MSLSVACDLFGRVRGRYLQAERLERMSPEQERRATAPQAQPAGRGTGCAA